MRTEWLFRALREVLSNLKRFFILLISTLLVLSLAGCEMPSISLTGYASYPEDDLQNFINCLSEGRYDDSSAFVNNYTSLGFQELTEGTIYASLLDSLNESRSFTVLGSSSVKGRNASMSIEFTTLDFSKLEDDLSAASLEAVNQHQFETGELPSDDEIEQLMVQELELLLSDSVKYYTTREFRLTFQYKDSVWRFDCTDEFYSALVGYIV